MSVPTIIAALRKDFPKSAIRKRAGQGGQAFDYVKGGDVIARLLDATNGAYSWTVTRLELLPVVGQAKYPTWLCQGHLDIPGLGSRAGVGTAQYINEDSVKSAETDALKRAAILFGVALQLYQDGTSPVEAPPPVEEKPTVPAGEGYALFCNVAFRFGRDFPSMPVKDRKEWLFVLNGSEMPTTKEERTPAYWHASCVGMIELGNAVRWDNEACRRVETFGAIAVDYCQFHSRDFWQMSNPVMQAVAKHLRGE